MRRPVRQNRARAQIARVGSLPAPVRGWNARDAIAGMAPGFALILDNFIPRAGYVELRRGNVQQVTGTGNVETLLVWRGGPVGGDKLLAAAGGSLYNVTVQGSAPAALASGYASNRWQYVNFSNAAGAFVIACNGSDAPIKFDGNAVTAAGITGPASPSALFGVMAHQSRLWFIEKGTLHAWYLATNAISGAATLFDLGGVFQEGGTLVACASWTIESVYGPNALAVFISDRGEAAIYSGTDPTSASTWSLTGVFTLGVPLGSRCISKRGGDLIVLTNEGAIPISQAIQRDRTEDEDVAITSNIRNAFLQSASQYGSNFGWQALMYPGGSLAIFNVPVAAGTSWQYVQNLTTGAWCRFTGLPANCWALCNTIPYFGSSTGVYQWDIGSADNGSPITYDLKTAFSDFGFPGLKDFTMMRAVIQSGANIQPALDLLTDYMEAAPVSIPTAFQAPGPQWDVSTWNNSVWADPNAITANWQGVGRSGFAGAARMQITLQAATGGHLLIGDGSILADGVGDEIAISQAAFEVPVKILRFDALFQPGGPL